MDYAWGCVKCDFKRSFEKHRAVVAHCASKRQFSKDDGHKQVLLYKGEIVYTPQKRMITSLKSARKFVKRDRKNEVPVKRKSPPPKLRAAVDTEYIGDPPKGNGSLSSKAIKGQIKTLLVDLDPRLTLLYDWVHSLVPDYDASFGDFIGDCVIGYCQDHAEQLHIEKLFQPVAAG
jgi:hypothetical protein